MKYLSLLCRWYACCFIYFFTIEAFVWIMPTDNGLDLPRRRTWGWGDCDVLEDSPKEVSEFWKMCFTMFDKDVIGSTSPGIFKSSQVLSFFGSQTFPSSRTSYLFWVTIFKSSRMYVFEMVPIVNILLSMHVWSVPTPDIVDAAVTTLQYDDWVCNFIIYSYCTEVFFSSISTASSNSGASQSCWP